MKIRRAALLLILACAAAQAGVKEPQGFRQDDYRAEVPATVAGGIIIHTKALKALLHKGEALPIDVLPAPRRPEGMRPEQPWMPVARRDIPGSLWLPEVGRGTLAPPVEQWFRDRLAQVTSGNKAQPLVFYCLSRCWMSWNAAKRAAQEGYSRVYWYPDGSDGWEKAGLPLAEAQPESPPAQSQ